MTRAKATVSQLRELPFRQKLMRATVLLIATSYAYVFSEWLFFATKPSMFSVSTAFETFSVLAISPLLLLAIGVVVLAIAAGALFLSRWEPLKLVELLPVAFPVLILTATEILMVENFTYTLFGFNVGSFDRIIPSIYALFFAAIFIWNLWLFGRLMISPAGNLLMAAFPCLVVISCLMAFFTKSDVGSLSSSYGDIDRSQTVPNILILSSDGVSASHMSIYGYHRKTTPFIESLSEESLVFENHFTNSERTTGSVASLFSGRLPTTTKLVFRPDIFKGVHVYQHFPGILRKLGYTLGDFSVRHYADPYDLNLRNGFHYANSRRLDEARNLAFMPALWRTLFPLSAFFLEQTFDRIENRVLYAFGIREFVDPYAAVMQLNHRSQGSDPERLADLFRFIGRTPGPFFAHVHLMGTHGPRFDPPISRFSRGKKQLRWYDDDFYDDAVLGYDTYVQSVVRFLKDSDQYQNTLLILTSDHGRAFSSQDPLPLIIKFPNADRRGTYSVTSQRIDIAPTLLDYLDVPVPEWMEGQSLLQDGLDPRRAIFVSETIEMEEIEGWWRSKSPQPPFYTLGALILIVCEDWYELDLTDMQMQHVQIKDHTLPCNRPMTIEEAKVVLLQHLERSGYEIP